MALIKCPECGREISTFANVCPNCGYPIKEKNLEEKYKVGSIIEFGSFPQSFDWQSGSGFKEKPIRWKILERMDDKALVLSEYALENQRYSSRTDVTWETCDLREWLNNRFLHNAFSAEEQSKIQSTLISADRNPEYSTNPGNNTIDKIFLLSVTEVEGYLTSREDRKCIPTERVMHGPAARDDEYTKNGQPTCDWWLRTPGEKQSLAVTIRAFYVYNYGVDVRNSYMCVRPAMWINLDS